MSPSQIRMIRITIRQLTFILLFKQVHEIIFKNVSPNDSFYVTQKNSSCESFIYIVDRVEKVNLFGQSWRIPVFPDWPSTHSKLINSM